MITRVEFKNLKGRTDGIDLGPANLITGRNFTGKTTVVDAIKLAFLGYHPALDRTVRGAMALASDTPMLAAVTLRAGGRDIILGNEWHKIGDSYRKRTFGPPPGMLPDTPIAALDAEEYFNRSDKGKVDLIFASAAIAPTPGFVASTLEILELSTDKGTAEEICHLAGGSAARSDQQWLQDAIDATELRRSGSAAAARRFTGAVQTATVLGEPVVPLPENINEVIANKRRDLETAVKALALMNEGKPPVTTPELEEARKALAQFKARIGQKDIEIGKAVDRLGALLAHEDCPMCGTAGDVWRDKAKELSATEQDQLREERGQIEREAYHTSEAIKEQVAALETRGKRWEARDRKKRSTLEETVAELREEIAGMERQLRQKAVAEATERGRATALAQWKRSEADENRFKLAKAALQKVKATMVDRVLNPILATANAFTEGILRGPLTFENGNLGYYQADHWISWRTFSGTEQAIAFCGFQAALAAHAPVKLAILDELGRLDRANKARLLSNVMAALQAGTIEQFIGVDTEPPQQNELGFTLIAR